jgi:ParB-like chromosome segregation protein Spo0J
MKWNYVERRMDELKPQAKNPRKISKAQKKELERSLAKFGVADPLITNPDGTIIAGHQRYYLLRQKGEKTVGCMVPDSPLEGRDLDELTIRHNKNTGEDDFVIYWLTDILLKISLIGVILWKSFT